MPEICKFSEMPYVRPDMEVVKAGYRAAIEALRSASSYEAAKKAFFDLQEKEESSRTMMSLAHTRNTIDTSDAYYEEEVRWLQAEFARLIPLQKEYREALAGSPFRKDFEAEFGAQLFKLIDAGLKVESPEIIEETIRDSELRQAYQKVTALASTDFRGEKCNFYGLLKHMESTDREERREAFHAWAGLYASIAPQLDEIYDEMVHLRTNMAHKLGFETYTDMAYLQRRRFDYTQADAAEFRRQVKEIITPAVAILREKQRKRLGLESLKYYDEALIFPEGNADPIGTKDELVAKALKMYREMSPETAEFFEFMTKYDLFDLETRPSKRMGGYCTRFASYKAPFIFSNFNGTSADVEVLTHEAGHAFQGYLAMRSIPVSMISGSTSEINEIHSMTMEHFAYPWMESFFGENTEKYLYSHLLGAISVIPYMVCVDEYQHRVYAEPDMTAAQRRAAWREIEKTYMPWRDYDGEEFLEGGGFWMQKQHIFLYPFYYIDYALAQICAFQYYGRMKENREQAWKDYLNLCRHGGTQGYFDLLKTGNLDNPLKPGTVQKSVDHVIRELFSYESPEERKRYREFTCERGGLKISGREYRTKDGVLPAVIVSHGFMGSQMGDEKDYAIYLAEKGYAAFTFDFCGGGPNVKSEGRTQDMTVFTEAEDLTTVFAYVKGLPNVDKEHIVLMGCSQGGFVSALTAAELKKDVDKLILFFPAFCIPDDARRGQMIMARFDPKNIPETVPCGPMLLGRCYPESVLELDPNEAIKAYEGPVLIIHGTADGLVNYRYSEAAQKAYADCRLVPIEGADHGFRGDEIPQALAAIDAFLGI